MPAPDPGSRPPLAALLLGFGLGAAGVAAVLAMRLPFAPTPVECVVGRLDGGAAWLAAGGCALAAAGLTAVMLRWKRRIDAFGSIAAIVLAAALPAFVTAVLGAVAPVAAAATAGVAVLLAVAGSAWLRERGVASLAVVTAVAAVPMLLALRKARLDGFAARPIRAVTQAALALPPDTAALGLLLTNDLDRAAIAALPAALAPRAVFAARAEAGASAWLLRMGLPVLRCGHDRAELVAGALELPLRAGGLTVSAELQRDAAGAPIGLVVACDRARLGHLAVVFTPIGELVTRFDGNGRAVFGAAATAGLRVWLTSMPSSPAIRVLVVPPETADVYGWTDLHP